MFKKWLIVATIVAVLATSLALVGCQNGSTVVSANQQQGIAVTGEGKVAVTPDLATLQLGVTTQAKTVADAQAQATAAMNKVMNSLTGNGIAAKDIQTSNYNISEVTQWNPTTQKSETTGYQVTNNVTVKVRELTKVGKIIDDVVTAGGDLTRVNSINFSVEDPTQYYDQARTLAVAQAVKKAESMAKLAGVKLGKLLFITESSSYVPPTVFYSKARPSKPALLTIKPSSTIS
ncbi:MAG: SIMPL domain-containing protein [Dehalococcoidales bacterium]|nr:SIMPL domain-containing protein [Dehalococcoidales bacterium]